MCFQHYFTMTDTIPVNSSPNLLLINLSSITGVGLVVLFLEIFGSPTKRGFFCNDESIRYPYEKNTVSEMSMVLAAILVPFIIIMVTEIWSTGLKPVGKTPKLWRIPIPDWLRNLGQMYGVYILGLGLSQIISSVGKFTIGRLRPHFISVCEPTVDCRTIVDNFTYIFDYDCLGKTDEVLEARQSFPSGHAALAFFSSLFLVIYIQNSSKWGWSKMIRSIIQFLLVLAAWWISLTRVKDHWHHSTDVLAGAVLGIFSAIVTVLYIPRLKAETENECDESLPLQRTSTNSYEPVTTP